VTAEKHPFMTVTVHFALSENAHYSQNVQDLRSCIPGVPDSVGVNALKRAQIPRGKRRHV